VKITARQFLSDDLKGGFWVGTVEDNEDPLFEGRVRVRVSGKLDGREDPEDPASAYNIPTDKLPWARPGNIMTAGSESGGGTLSAPKVGSMVQVTFDSGDLYSPVYHYNLYPSDEVKEEIKDSYANSHILVYDSETEGSLKIYFTEAKGLMLDYQGNTINILPGGDINITTGANCNISTDGDTTINSVGDTIVFCDNLNAAANNDVDISCVNATLTASAEAHINSPRIKLGEAAAEAVIKGDTFQGIFDAHIHPTGVGPSGPPTTSASPALSAKNTTD